MNNLNDIFFAPVANQDLTYDQVLEDVQRYILNPTIEGFSDFPGSQRMDGNGFAALNAVDCLTA